MKTFRVFSGHWEDEVDVDTDIFETYDSQAQEAIALSLERWLRSESDAPVGVLTGAYDINDPNYAANTFVMHNESAFEYVGRLDMVNRVQNKQDTDIF